MMNMADHDAYKDMDDREDNSSDAYGNPGDIDGRATMVPPSGFSTLHVSTNISKLSNIYMKYFSNSNYMKPFTTFVLQNCKTV